MEKLKFWQWCIVIMLIVPISILLIPFSGVLSQYDDTFRKDY